MTPIERELIALVRKAFERPALLSPADLQPLREVAGDAALDYTLVLGGFHFVNRMADTLGLTTEVFPTSLRRFEPLRRLSVRIASFIIGKMDLINRDYGISYQEALGNLAPSFERATGRKPGNEFATLEPRPKLIEAYQLALEERDDRSSLDRETLARVHRTVESALPSGGEEAGGFHARPQDPVEDFAFVGTRYAHRTTREMIDSLRRAGYDDLGILDLAIAVADANMWARLHRLTGLDPGLFYVGTEGSA